MTATMAGWETPSRRNGSGSDCSDRYRTGGFVGDTV